jgi:hypothetical protein
MKGKLHTATKGFSNTIGSHEKSLVTILSCLVKGGLVGIGIIGIDPVVSLPLALFSDKL